MSGTATGLRTVRTGCHNERHHRDEEEKTRSPDRYFRAIVAGLIPRVIGPAPGLLLREIQLLIAHIPSHPNASTGG